MGNHEKIELTNMCMIYDDEGNVLVQDKKSITWGGLTFPGGHVKKGESFIDSVIREVKEETGLDIVNPTLCGIKWWNTNRNSRYIVFLYKTNDFSGSLKSSSEGKVFWTKLSDLNSLNLAESFDNMLKVFTDDKLQEHIQLKQNNEWIDILK